MPCDGTRNWSCWRGRGDTSAFDQLVVRYQAAVYRAALAALRGVPEDAEDVAQEAFVRAWSTLKRLRGEASFKTWLLTIAWNRAIIAGACG